MRNYLFLLSFLFILTSCGGGGIPIGNEYRKIEKEIDKARADYDGERVSELVKKRDEFVESLIGTKQEITCYTYTLSYEKERPSGTSFDDLDYDKSKENYPNWDISCNEFNKKSFDDRGSRFNILISEVYLTKKEREYLKSLNRKYLSREKPKLRFTGKVTKVVKGGSQMSIYFDNRVWRCQEKDITKFTRLELLLDGLCTTIHQKEKTIFFDTN